VPVVSERRAERTSSGWFPPGKPPRRRRRRIPPPWRQVAVVLSVWLLAAGVAPAQQQVAANDQERWKHLTIQELLEIDVTTAARRADPIRTTAAPVQVLTRDDLHRAGVRYLAEAFRLADALFVGRFDGRTWIVSARGLAINGANKMQVMIDGRSIYSPFYSGVFWDAQDVLIDDVDRIEIIRGPGASLWGANAMHGIINVITRRADDTQGTVVTLGSGTEERAIADLRHGGRLGTAAAYRAYVKYGYRDAQSLSTGVSAQDPFRRGQVGGRVDWALSANDDLSVLGDAYIGRLGLINAPDTPISGGNVIARWSRRGRRGSSQVQAYFDRVERHVPRQFGERRNTVDIDAQYGLVGPARHNLVFGGGYRASADETDVTETLYFEPRERTTHLFNLFAQDEIALGRGFFGILGTRLEHNSYSGWELQPTGRIRWTRGHDTVWGAVSRAVRMPTRFDSDLRFTAGLPFLVATGSTAFRPEQMLAYEAGYRTQPASRVSFEAAVYHNRYDDLRSQEQRPGQPIVLANTIEGEISGLELGATWEPAAHVRVHGSYAWLTRSLRRKPGSLDITGGEGFDAPHQATLRLFTDLRPGVRLNVMGRYVDALPRTSIPAYVEADVTLQWDVRPWAELALVGQNLVHDRHAEFGGGTIVEEFDRGVFLTLTLRRR
jgi:iron complex outermembrane receptor protein